MKYKCTIGKDGRKYYFKNGKRVSPRSIKKKRMKKLKCKKSKTRRRKKGTYCRKGADGRKYYFKDGKRVPKRSIKKKKRKKLKCKKSKQTKRKIRKRKKESKKQKEDKPEIIKKVGKDNKEYLYDVKTKTRVKKDGTKKNIKKTGYYCIKGNDGKVYYFKDGQRIKSDDIPIDIRLSLECTPTTRVRKVDKFKDSMKKRKLRGECKDRIIDHTLNEYQEKCVDYMKTHNNLLVCHATGLGKTLTSITASQCFLDDNNRDGMVLVVCPASVVEQYKDQLIKFYGGKDMDRYMIISYNNMRINSDVVNCKNKFMILDEVHNLRNYDSQTYKSIIKCAKLCQKRMLLSATPYINDIRDFISIINILHGDENLVGSEYPKKNKEILPTKQYYINHKLPFDENVGFVTLCAEKLNMHYVENKDTRYFPSVNEQYIEVKMNKEWEKQYKQLVSGNKVYNIMFSTPEAFYNAHRRAVNDIGGDDYFSMKLGAVLDIIKDGKTLIYTNWIDFGIKPIQKFLVENEITYNSFTGSVSSKERLKLVTSFNEGKVDVLIITAAGGEGLDLKGVRNIIILDPVWNHAKLRQIIGRGVRYKSHAHLPEDERNVNVYKMILLERKVGSNWLCDKNKSMSGDAILYRIIEKKKVFNDNLKILYNSITI